MLTRLALPHIIKTKGTVVNVSSIAGPCVFPGVAYYCMSKAAIDQFTKCLALEMAPHGVRVNAVNPGVIVTEVHKRAGMDDRTYEGFLEKCKKTHALGRVGEPAEVAEAVLFLASEKSSFTTGELLKVDGGRGIMTPGP
ncbi:Oxidoreductase [Trichostrongylus colubriformis]|uniref:Oxidoreductase n=1 Tax=Trichostrongylus colubriformis TaxID=6319 RepID=A0AAN8IU18_TRICO